MDVKCKSRKRYFFIQYNMYPTFFSLNAIQARKIKYCVTKIDNKRPHDLLKKRHFARLGNVLEIARWAAKYEPCNNPQITKFHDAPCHNPPRNITMNKLRYVLGSDFLFPPSGMYR